MHSNYSLIFFIINFYFNIILRSTLWSTFLLSLSHYHSNTKKKYNIFPAALFNNIKKSKNLLINSQISKRTITTFLLAHFHPQPSSPLVASSSREHPLPQKKTRLSFYHYSGSHKLSRCFFGCLNCGCLGKKKIYGHISSLLGVAYY